MKLGFLHGKKYLFFITLYVSDLLMYLLSGMIAIFALKLHVLYPFELYARFLIFGLLILMLNYSSFGLYREKRNLFDDADFMAILYSSAITFFVMSMFVIIFDPRDFALVFMAALALFAVVVLTSISRFYVFKLIQLFRRKGYDHKRVVFYGSLNDDLVKKIEENKALGYDIIRIAEDFEGLKRSLARAEIVFVSKSQVDDKLLELMIEHDKIDWKIVSPLLNLVIDPVTFDEFKDYPIINVSNRKTNRGYAFYKRAFDLIVSGLSLVLLSPLFVLVAIGIKLSSPGPVYFRQVRMGKSLRPFMLYKFRTMVTDAESMKSELGSKNEVKGLFKMKDDPRITKLGKFLRRTAIDELPQLINVFLGEMSIVGPRPHLRSELSHFEGWRRARFKVKPGLTGLWQVSGRHELNFDKAVLYDIYYIKHIGFLLDLQIILRTIPSIIMSRGRF